jgi:hypothetical protein
VVVLPGVCDGAKCKRMRKAFTDSMLGWHIARGLFVLCDSLTRTLHMHLSSERENPKGKQAVEKLDTQYRLAMVLRSLDNNVF